MENSKKRKITYLEDAENTFANTKKILNDIMILKSGANDSSQKQNELLKECTMLFLDLKHFNREIIIDVERQRNEINKEKTKLDPKNSQLQNLLYQKEHLKQQIASCRDFKSKESEIDLISEEEVLKVQQTRAQDASASDAASQTLITEQGDHEKMLTRLKMELEMRKSLRVQIQELEARKKALSEVLSQKRKSLDTLNNKFVGLKQNISSIQDFIHVSHPAKENKNTAPLSAANQLPLPLYTVYHSLLAFKDTSDIRLNVLLETCEEAHVDSKVASSQAVVAEFCVESHDENENSMSTGQLSDVAIDSAEIPVIIRFAHFIASNSVGCSIKTEADGPTLLGSLYSDDQGSKIDSNYYSYRWLDYIAGTSTMKVPMLKEGTPVADLIHKIKSQLNNKKS